MAKNITLKQVEKELLTKLPEWLHKFELSHLETFIEFQSPEELATTLNEDDEERAYAAFFYDEIHGRLTLYFDSTLSWLDDGFSTDVVLLHELMHVKLYTIRDFVFRVMQHYIPEKSKGFVESEYRDIEEAVVDSLARCIYALIYPSLQLLKEQKDSEEKNSIENLVDEALEKIDNRISKSSKKKA